MCVHTYTCILIHVYMFIYKHKCKDPKQNTDKSNSGTMLITKSVAAELRVRKSFEEQQCCGKEHRLCNQTTEF